MSCRLAMALTVLFIAALWAGVQNALAGGGSFITLPSLMLTGMDARAANITSTIALFPAQLVTGAHRPAHVTGAAGLSFTDAGGDQPCRRGAGRHAAAGHAAPVFRRSGALAGAVRHRRFRLWQFRAPSRDRAPRLGKIGAGIAQFLISRSMAAISAAASAF